MSLFTFGEYKKRLQAKIDGLRKRLSETSDDDPIHAGISRELHELEQLLQSITFGRQQQ